MKETCQHPLAETGAICGVPARDAVLQGAIRFVCPRHAAVVARRDPALVLVAIARDRFDAICACAWHGRVAETAPCPGCGRDGSYRVDEGRIAVMRLVKSTPDADIPRLQRQRMIRIGMLITTSDRIPPNDNGRHKRLPRRHHQVTEAGERVLAVAELLDLEARRREHVAAAAARHSDIGTDSKRST